MAIDDAASNICQALAAGTYRAADGRGGGAARGWAPGRANTK